MTRLEHDWFPRPLPPNIRIDDRSWIYSSYAFVYCRSKCDVAVRIGCDSGIYNGSFFNLGPLGSVEIGRFCAVVGAIFHTNQRVVIEDYSFVAHEVIIADRFVAAPDLFPGAPESDVTKVSVLIGENAWIGTRAILLGGARIGRNSIVGAGALVDFEVPPDVIVAGNPARIVSRR